MPYIRIIHCDAAISVKRVQLRFIWFTASLTSLYTSLLEFKGGINYGDTGCFPLRGAAKGERYSSPSRGEETHFSLHFAAETVALSDRFICQVLWADVYANDSPLVG